MKGPGSRCGSGSERAAMQVRCIAICSRDTQRRNGAYHTLTHIENCLDELSCVPDAALDRDALRFALWFHDAIYDTHAHDNEERSAALAAQVARGGEARCAVLREGHGPDYGDEACGATCGASCAGDGGRRSRDLGKVQSEFDEYERQIRREYAWVAPAPERRTGDRGLWPVHREGTRVRRGTPDRRHKSIARPTPDAA